MVSLSRNFNTSTGGGVFFNDASLSIDGNDTQQLQPILGADVEKKFTPLETVAVILAELTLCVGVLVTAIVLAVVWKGETEKCLPYFVILYIHALFWCISLIVDNRIKRKHHALRINGYLEFYQKTHSHCRVPFYVVSLWNAVLLVLSTVLQHMYKEFEQQCNVEGFLKPVNYLCIAVAVETVILTGVVITYVRRVVQFNRSRPPPDVQREEWMISFIQDSYSAGEIGYRERSDHVQDLLEKQADLIRSLKDRNAKLSHKILLLSERIHREES